MNPLDLLRRQPKPGALHAKVFSQLESLSKKAPKSRQSFTFHFGPFEILNATSASAQYLDIFLKRGYDFDSKDDTPLILDCGGNIGLSAVRFKEIFPKARVIVFEADPEVAQVLKRNLDSLKLSDVEVRNQAVWNEKSVLRFHSSQDDAGFVDPKNGSIQVEAIRLSDVITEPVALLKLDIEGAEFKVLLDLCETGKIDNVDKLICEIHCNQETEPEFARVLSELSGRGFRYALHYACTDPGLPGGTDKAPFFGLLSGKFLAHLYVWKESQ